MKVRHDVDATTLKRKKVRRVVIAATLAAAALAPFAPATAHVDSAYKTLHDGGGCCCCR